MSWKDESCEDCEYQIDCECRFGPPIYAIVANEYGKEELELIYPYVYRVSNYQEACSQWEEKTDE